VDLGADFLVDLVVFALVMLSYLMMLAD